MSLSLNGGTTLSLLRLIKSLRNGIPVILLADKNSVEAAVTAMRLGATDVLSLPFDQEHLLNVVREALRSDVHVGAFRGGRRQVEIRGFSQLTPREREVLQMITDGHSNKSTGRTLNISPRTVEVDRARVMEKRGARNTAELIRILLTQ